jgi:hypothetical protein
VNPHGADGEPGSDVRARLRAALGDVLRGRDMVAASALRSALGAIGNAGAVPPATEPAAGAGGEHFAAGVARAIAFGEFLAKVALALAPGGEGFANLSREQAKLQRDTGRVESLGIPVIPGQFHPRPTAPR